MQSVIITKNQAGQRLDKFLKKYLPEAEPGFLYKMLRKKNITLNGRKAEGKEMLSEEDQVCFFFSDETLLKFRGNIKAPEIKGKDSGPNRMGNGSTEYRKAYQTLPQMEILYEDDNILAINKHAGVLTQKASQRDLSLNEWLIGYLLEKGNITEEELLTFRPSVCNRLDRNTSGIVLCGKSLWGSQILSEMIREHTLRKFYHTICVGKLEEESILEGYLIKDTAANKVAISGNSKSGRKNTEGDYIKTAYHPISLSKNYTLLEVELFTGKTHQIRAHLSSIGHPIIGDYKYGNNGINNALKKDVGLDAQLLHAYRVEFPVDKALPKELSGLVIMAPYPEMFQKVKKQL